MASQKWSYRFGKSGFWCGMLLLLTSCSLGGLNESQPICDLDEYQKAIAIPREPELVPRIPGIVSKMPLNHLNITDKSILKKVMVHSLNVDRNEHGRIRVWARLVNCTEFPLQVEGRTHFLTDMQAPAEPVSAWKRVHLPPKTFSIYEIQSLTGKEAFSFLIEMREGK
ncbi:MAG: hypothetical protein HQM03_01525 [Magnetococcales bacterium]|nr:hypothetical protein [Magnetococcales bacterium]